MKIKLSELKKIIREEANTPPQSDIDVFLEEIVLEATADAEAGQYMDPQAIAEKWKKYASPELFRAYPDVYRWLLSMSLEDRAGRVQAMMAELDIPNTRVRESKIKPSELKQIIQEETSHTEAMAQLESEYPDWTPGDLQDVAMTTATTMSPASEEVQLRYQELRGFKDDAGGYWPSREDMRTFVAEIVVYAYPGADYEEVEAWGEEGNVEDPAYLAQDVDTIITAAEEAGYEDSAELRYFMELSPGERLTWFKELL
jgi:hypothetical protein